IAHSAGIEPERRSIEAEVIPWPIIGGINHAGVQTLGGVATAIFNVAVAQGRESIIELVTGILQVGNLAVNRRIFGWQKNLGAAAGSKGDDQKQEPTSNKQLVQKSRHGVTRPTSIRISALFF